MGIDTYFHTTITGAFPGAVLFLVLYGVTSPWWSTFIGRALFIKSCGVTVMLAFTAFLIWFGPGYPGRDILRVVGGTLIFLGVWSQVVSLVWEKFIRKNPPRLSRRSYTRPTRTRKKT